MCAYKKASRSSVRRGATLALMAIVLPILVLVGMIAINLASMQLARTELKIATDASARAGGRAWSEHQSQDIAVDFAQRAARLNKVNGKPLSLKSSGNEIEFGFSQRAGTDGRFEFTQLPDKSDTSLSTGIRVSASLEDSLLFKIGDNETYGLSATSVASQVDRDIALVIDRSGSMAYYQDEDALYDTITALYNDSSNGITRAEYTDAVADYQPIGRLAALSLSSRKYSNRVINLLSGDMKQYAITVNTQYRTHLGAPDFSRWALLEEAMDAFFGILRDSDQSELISVSSFASRAELNVPLTRDLDEALSSILALRPDGGTAIGSGILQGVKTLADERARQDSVHSIIVFSDGENKTGTLPETAARQIKRNNPRVIINTVTFAAGDQNEMMRVAEIGGGRHFHAESGPQLIRIFEQLAASFRTLITE